MVKKPILRVKRRGERLDGNVVLARLCSHESCISSLFFLSFPYSSPFSDTEKMIKTLGKDVETAQALLIMILLELFITMWAKRDALASLFSHVFASRKGIYDYDPDLLSSPLKRVMGIIK